jgi:hypothetical protein
MNPDHIVLYKDEHQKLQFILGKIQRDLRACMVLLINRSGHQIGYAGSARDIDLTALASVAAANLAATNMLARLVGEMGFSVLHHQGTNRSLHISAFGERFSLVLVFAEPVAVGIVRWKLNRTIPLLVDVFEKFVSSRSSSLTPPPADPADDSVKLFSDDELEKLLGQSPL